MGLLIVIFLPTACTAIGCCITAGRMLWTLGRDNATPFSKWIGHIDKRFECPLNATLVCGIINTILGCIYIGSLTAFSAFVGSFIVLSSASYLAFILPNIITRRKHITPGPFSMPDWIFYPLAGTACAYMCVFIVIYCFPYGVPFTAQTMNYSSLIVGGLSIFVAGWWFYIKDKGYIGPKDLEEEVRRLSVVEGVGRVSVSKG
jgi:choline transport protein